MASKFYINIDALNDYAKCLKQHVANINKQVVDISKANSKYQATTQDKVSAQVDIHIKKLKKIFSKFSLEVDKMSKEVKANYIKLNAFNSTKLGGGK